jgi:hypothetical protein
MIQRALIISCLAVFLFALAQAGYLLFSHFPLSYTWTELMINYQGGFVRRGLLGELAFQLNPFIEAPYFLTAVVLASYVIVTVWMVITVFSRVDISVAIGILFLTAWQLNHFAEVGTDPLRPGLLFMRNQVAD